MELGDGFLSVALLVPTVPDGKRDGGFGGRELGIVFIVVHQRAFKNHGPSIVEPYALKPPASVGKSSGLNP